MPRALGTDGESPFTLARRKARHGHRDWLVWRTKDGRAQAARRTAASVKAAMLACGTQGRFTMFGASSATPFLVNWRLAVNLLANDRRGRAR